MIRRGTPVAGLVFLCAALSFGQVCELEIRDSVSTPGTLGQPLTVGSTAYVAGGQAGLVRIDISNPDQLLSLGATNTQGRAEDIAYEYFGNMLVVADGSAGIGTYNLQDNGPPGHIATTNFGTSMISINGSAGDFVAGGNNGTLYLVTLDGDDRAVVEGQIGLAGQVVDVLEHSRTAYCALGSANAVAVVDVQHRESPTVKGLYNVSGPVLSVGLVGDLLIAGVEGTGLVVFEIRDEAIVEVSTVDLPSAPTNLTYWNERLYMAGPDLGLVVADPTLGTEIIPLAQLDLPGAAAQALVGNTLFVGRGGNGFSSVDTSDCANSSGSLTTWFIPAGARAAGAAGSFWLTDLAIANFSPGVATVNVAYLAKNQDNTNPLNASMALGSGRQLFSGDVFFNLFGRESANGGLRISTSHPDVRITSRTYNAAGSEGTYGQFIPARPTAGAVTTDNSGAILQLQHNDDFRTNIGIINLQDELVDVEIDLYLDDGTLLGTVGRQLRSFEMKQIDRIYQNVTSDPVDSGFAVARVLTSGGEVHAYASVVDNGSNDPVYVAAQPLSDSSPYLD